MQRTAEVLDGAFKGLSLKHIYYMEYAEDGTVQKLRDDWNWPSYTQGTDVYKRQGETPDRGSDDRMSEKFVGEWIKGAKDKSFI